MTKRFTGIAVIVLVASGLVGAWSSRHHEPASPLMLPTGKAISPTGSLVGVGSFPANLALSPDGKFLAVTDTGFREHISILDAQSGALLSSLKFETKDDGALYYGLAFAPSTKTGYLLFASRGPEDRVSVFNIDAQGQISDPHQSIVENSSENGPRFIAGIATDSSGSMLYVANNHTSQKSGFNGSFSVLSVEKGKEVGTIATPGYPFAVAAVTRGREADRLVYVSSERDGVVTAIDTTNPQEPRLLTNIATGDHPIALRLDRENRRLFVANAGSDTVSEIDTHTQQVTHTYLVRPIEARSLPGTTPTGIALSADEQTMYVTLGDMNAVAVVSIGTTPGLKGYIPTGWYPTAIEASADGKRLLIADAKGGQAVNPNRAPVGEGGVLGTYIENIIEGSVQITAIPSNSVLRSMTRDVLANNSFGKNVRLSSLGTLRDLGIRHVVYIIRENRTYDNVLGDVAGGNGDPSLTLFGKDVTPNMHALAERFVLLDNFYCCAEVSADGWDWSTSGMASEYTERNVPFNYSGRGGAYDYEGESDNTPVDLIGVPDVAKAPSGYIWDQVAKKGLTYRNYGFYVSFAKSLDKDGNLISEENTATKRVLFDHTDNNFRRFDTSYADSDAWLKYDSAAPKQKKAYGENHAPSRFSEWNREFNDYVKDGNFPNFSMVRLMRDHTAGTSTGQSSPRAMVADNDYAVGQLVEVISKSPYWKSTAIFVVEDDAQDGLDHVDAHRSPCLVISPLIEKHKIDHRFYNTDSVLRTMEVLLGLQPMSQYDASASLLDVFNPQTHNDQPFEAILPSREIVTEVNKKGDPGEALSETLDFTHEDRVPGPIMADILWHSVKGANVRVPTSPKPAVPPKRAD